MLLRSRTALRKREPRASRCTLRSRPTIRNGLAVTATGMYSPGEPAVYHGPMMAPEDPEHVDDIEVRTVAAPHFRQPLSRDGRSAH